MEYPTREQAETMNGCESCEACMDNKAADFCHWPGEAFVKIHDELDKRSDLIARMAAVITEQRDQLDAFVDLQQRMVRGIVNIGRDNPRDILDEARTMLSCTIRYEGGK